MSTRSSAILAFLACTLFTACRRSPPELPPPVPIEIEPVAATLEALATEAESVQRYQGFVRIRGRGPDGGFSGRLVVVFERPDRLRVDLLGAFGATRWSAVATGDGISVVFPGDRRYVEETDTADIVGRLLGIRLSPAEVMALLSGTGMPLEDEPIEAASRGPHREATMPGGERVELSSDDQIVRVTTVHYRASYESEWRARRRHVPDSIRLETSTIQATLSPEDVDVNVQLDPEAFTVEIPDGAERLRPSDVSGEAVFVVTQERK